MQAVELVQVGARGQSLPRNLARVESSDSRKEFLYPKAPTRLTRRFAAHRATTLARTTSMRSRQRARRPARSSTASWPMTRAPRTTARLSATAVPARSAPSGPRSTAATPRSTSKAAVVPRARSLPVRRVSLLKFPSRAQDFFRFYHYTL